VDDGRAGWSADVDAVGEPDGPAPTILVFVVPPHDAITIAAHSNAPIEEAPRFICGSYGTQGQQPVMPNRENAVTVPGPRDRSQREVVSPKRLSDRPTTIAAIASVELTPKLAWSSAMTLSIGRSARRSSCAR